MKNFMLMLTLVVWVMPSYAQNYLDILRPFSGMEGRASLGGGEIPLADADANALAGNPAQLSFVGRKSLTIDMSYNTASGESIFDKRLWKTSENASLFFNNLTYLHPVKVYRGAWVWGVSIHPIRSFMSSARFSDTDPSGDFDYSRSADSQGGLYAYTLGTAFLATMNTSVGFSFSIINGQNQTNSVYRELDALDLYTFSEYVDSLHFAPEYWGFGGRIGLVTELDNGLQLGASVELPTRVSITESSSASTKEWFDDGSETVHYEDERHGLEYRAWGPTRLALGLGYLNRPLHLTLNYRYHHYSGLSFRGDILDPYTGDDISTSIANEVDTYVQDVNEFSAGLGWDMRPLNFFIGGSFMNDALVYNLDNIYRTDVGISYEFQSGLRVSLAWRNEHWQSNLDHEIDSGAERIVDVENRLQMLQFGTTYYF